MTSQAQQCRRNYQKSWRDKNKEHLKVYRKNYYANNKDKFATYNARHWIKKAESEVNNND